MLSVCIGTIDNHSFSMYWYHILSIVVLSKGSFYWLSVSLKRCALFTVLASFKNLHFDTFFAAFTRSSVCHITYPVLFAHPSSPVMEQTKGTFPDTSAMFRLNFQN